MKRLIITALLGGAAAVPAQAADYYQPFFELRGTYTAMTFDQSLPRTDVPTGVYSGDFTFIGTCSGSCTMGFSLTGLSFTAIERVAFASVNFRYDEPATQYYDDVWHNGTGTGIFSVGYIQYITYELTPTSGRIWTDGSGYGAGNVWPEFRTYNEVSYGVPEPATWAMMIGGFALAGSALRRRRYRAAFG